MRHCQCKAIRLFTHNCEQAAEENLGDGTEWQSDILGTLPKILGNLKRRWTQPDVRDEVIDYVHNWSDKTEISEPRLVGWIGISRSKYYDWRKRYGKVIEHNALVPRAGLWSSRERQPPFKDNCFSLPG